MTQAIAMSRPIFPQVEPKAAVIRLRSVLLFEKSLAFADASALNSSWRF